jgi:hypothetical protein
VSESPPPLKGLVALLFSCALAACSGTKDDLPLAAEPSRTHGFVSVEQHLATLTERETDTAVMFGVLRMPPAVSPGRMLRLMGMGNELPEPGTCEVFDSSTIASPSLSAYERVELLDVGDLSLTTSRTTKFARQAFPTVTDFISGVLYTTRYQATEADRTVSFALKSRGSGALPAFNVTFTPLAAPEQLTLEGVPLAEFTRMHALSRAELRWAPGRRLDSLWVELQTDRGHKSLNCTFDDATGSGLIPTELLGETGEGRLTVHRIHRRSLSIPHLDSAEVYVDVRVSQPLVIY